MHEICIGENVDNQLWLDSLEENTLALTVC